MFFSRFSIRAGLLAELPLRHPEPCLLHICKGLKLGGREHQELQALAQLVDAPTLLALVLRIGSLADVLTR